MIESEWRIAAEKSLNEPGGPLVGVIRNSQVVRGGDTQPRLV